MMERRKHPNTRHKSIESLRYAVMCNMTACLAAIGPGRWLVFMAYGDPRRTPPAPTPLQAELAVGSASERPFPHLFGLEHVNCILEN